jgi:hypothetical protein
MNLGYKPGTLFTLRIQTFNVPLLFIRFRGTGFELMALCLQVRGAPLEPQHQPFLL